MEYLTELFCPAEGLKLPAYNLVVLCATFGDTNLGNPGGDKAWGAQGSPQLSIEAEIAQSDCRLAKGFSANPWLVADWGAIQL